MAQRADMRGHLGAIDLPTLLLCGVEDAITPRTRAIVPVHLCGRPCNMDAIVDIAQRHDLIVIEDAAQAIGADCPFQDGDRTTWKRAGSIGTAGCFSFFPSKNLGGIGDGGMVTTNDETFAGRLKSLRNHGAEPKYHHTVVGGNFRLDPVQATVLNIKLKHLEDWHQGRRRNASLYRQYFERYGLADGVVKLPEAVFSGNVNGGESNYHIYNQYVVRVLDRDKLRDFLQQQGIGCEVYYPVSLHQQKCLQPYGFKNISLPVAERASLETLALPVYPDLLPDQLEYVVQKIAEFYQP